jgi:hypothetical protein
MELDGQVYGVMVRGRLVASVYVAKVQGIDVGRSKYAVVCERHSTIMPANRLSTAKYDADNTAEWCDVTGVRGCRGSASVRRERHVLAS